MSESIYTLVRDLFALSGTTNLKLAISAGVSPPNLSSWLKHGKMMIGEDKQHRLLEALGVSGGTLRKDRVHVWNWKLKEADIGPLVRTLMWAGGTYEMIFIVPIGRNITEWNFPLPLAIYDRKLPLRILLLRTISPLIPEQDLPLLDPGIMPPGKIHWRPRSRYQAVHPSGHVEALQIEDKIFDEWEKGAISVEDYDRVLWKEEESSDNKSPKNLMTWESFGQRLEHWGIFQSDVLEKFPMAKNPPE